MRYGPYLGIEAQPAILIRAVRPGAPRILLAGVIEGLSERAFLVQHRVHHDGRIPVLIREQMAVNLKHHGGVAVSEHPGDFHQFAAAAQQITRYRMTQRVGVVPGKARLYEGGCPVLVNSRLVERAAIDRGEDQTLFLPRVPGLPVCEVLSISVRL